MFQTRDNGRLQRCGERCNLELFKLIMRAWRVLFSMKRAEILDLIPKLE
jgi:hypothetical protein